MMRKKLRSYREAFGRRGALLVLFGSLNALTGWRILRIPGTAVYVRSYVEDLMPRNDWAVLWILTGVIALLFALVPKRHQGEDGPGFVSALLVPLVWFACFLTQGIVQHDIDLLLNAVTYTLWVGVLVISAGWPEPPRLDSLKKRGD